MDFQFGYPKRCGIVYAVIAINVNIICLISLIIIYVYYASGALGITWHLYTNVAENKNADTPLRSLTSELHLQAYHDEIPVSIERPDWCKNCFTRPYEFIIESPWVCRNTTQIDLLVVIISGPRNWHRRNIVRTTWANNMNIYGNTNVKHIFLIGNSPFNRRIRNENSIFGDLTLQNFKDSYLNLTLKTLMGLEWGRKFCPQAKQIMKTDDDVFVIIPRVLQLIGQVNHSLSIVYGHCSRNVKPVRNEPIKETMRKFFTPYTRYPHPVYPPYCQGIGYILSAQTADSVLSISLNIPFFEWEDVYIGMCLKAIGITLQSVKHFDLSLEYNEINNCSYYTQSKWYVGLYHDRFSARQTWDNCIIPLFRKDRNCITDRLDDIICDTYDHTKIERPLQINP